jgi:tetratricopeptide (TPR) repeat protein
MAVVQDQLGRVLANQGFFAKSIMYFNGSLESLSLQRKESINQLHLAFKLANMGSVEYRIADYAHSIAHTEKALEII